MTAFERRFMAVTSIVILILGVAVYAFLASFSTRLALDSAAADTERESAYLAAAMVGMRLDRPLSAEDQRKVGDVVGQTLPGYVAVKVWSPDGHVAFSTEPEIIGRSFPLTDDITEALAGQTHADVNHTDKPENISERARGLRELLEVYTPLRAAGGQVVGAFELYRSATPLLANLHRTRVFLGLTLAVALLLLWASLFAWVHQAGSTLARQNAALRRLSEDLRQAYEQLRETTEGALLALSEAVEAKDAYTGGHVRRVRDLALSAGAGLGLEPETLARLEFGAVLHDIGKLSVDDAILRKPGPLDREERLAMQTHAARGAHLVSKVPGLAGAAAAIHFHHERWDGGGYPDGLRGPAIPVEARIIAVADAFDAMTTDRPYRRALPREEAVAELRRESGAQFDPAVVEAMLAALAAPAPAAGARRPQPLAPALPVGKTRAKPKGSLA